MLQSIIFLLLTVMSGNVFCTTPGPLKPLHLEEIDDQTTDSFQPFVMNNINVQELNTDEPYLWQMAAYAARQMTNKQIKYKMITLNSAEKIDSIYRLRISLKRIYLNGEAKSSVLHCTVEMNDDNGQELESFGCTLPALIRDRKTNSFITEHENTVNFDADDNDEENVDNNSVDHDKNDTNKVMKQEDKYKQPLDNNINVDDNDNEKTNFILKVKPPQRPIIFMSQPQRHQANPFFYGAERSMAPIPASNLKKSISHQRNGFYPFIIQEYIPHYQYQQMPTFNHPMDNFHEHYQILNF